MKITGTSFDRALTLCARALRLSLRLSFYAVAVVVVEPVAARCATALKH